MTTFLQAVKLLYYCDDNPSYWEPVIDSLWGEFYANNPGDKSGGIYIYIQETYGAEWNFDKQLVRAFVFDSEESKLLFALRFPGLE